MFKVFASGETRRGRVALASLTALAVIVGVGLPRMMPAAQAAGGTIDVNPAPTFTNNNANVTEGNFGTTNVTVTFKLSQDNANEVKVHYSTADGTATSADYVSQSNDVVFAPHETSKNVVFNVKGDTTDEPDESFKVQLGTITQTGPDSFTKGNDGTVTILDDDAPPGISVADTSVDEGTGGTPPKLVFTATLSAPVASNKTYYVFTGNPTRDSDPNTSGVQPHRAATSGDDYTPLTGAPLVIEAGKSTGTVEVTVNPDTRDEVDEWVALNVKSVNDANASNAAYGEGQIKDDDALSVLNVSDPAGVQEQNTPCGHPLDAQQACPTNITFTVTLTPASDKYVIVDYATADRTATSNPNDPNADYIAKSGAGNPGANPPGTGLLFNPGETTKTVTVPVRGDTNAEPDETFVLNLSNEVNAVLGDAQATGLITNDDAGSFPSVSVTNAADAVEGGTSTFTINVSRPSLNTQNVTVLYQTADGPESGTGAPATGGSDYTAQTNKSVTINYPNTSATVTVPTTNDTLDEPDEFFQLQLTGATNSSITDGVGQAKITDNDAAPTLSIADKGVSEGTAATPTTATMTVTLTPASGQTVTVHYATADGTAKATDDYAATAGTLTFAPGDTTKTFDIPVVADNIDEDAETVNVALTDPTGNATVADGAGVLTITDDDGVPSITISSPTVTEGTASNSTAVFQVQLSAPSSKPITVHAATDPGSGTATAGTDYTTTGTDLTFAPGVTEQDFSVPVLADSADEPNETFTSTLSAPNNNAVLGTPKTGTATIADDDDAAQFAVSDASVTEGSAGTTNATFTVTKTGSTTQTATVHWATSDGSAKQPGDYTASSGDLSFAPADTTKTFTVPVVGDTTDEPDETFIVTLTNPSNASLSDDTGTGTITDDDVPAGAPTISVSNATATEGDNATFTFTLSAAAGSDMTVNYSTADGTAKAPGDYTAVPAGVATITAGQTSKTVDVPTTEDTTTEPQETFTLTVNSATGANVDPAHKTGTATINDDDGAATKAQMTTGAGPGGGPHIQSFVTNSPNPVASFMDGAESTGKRVARGDVDGDGVDEIITGSGPNSAAVLSVYSAAGQLKASAFAYGGGRFYGGVFVAAGDLDGDGKAEVITGAGPGGGPHVIVWKVQGSSLAPIAGGFFAYGPEFAGGVTVGAADLTGDGRAEILTGPGAGGGPHVRSFDMNGTPGAVSFMAYTDPNAQPNWTGGVNVAGGDVDGDGKAEIAVVPWNGGGPHMRLFNNDGSLRNGGIMVGSPNFPGGLTVAMGDLSGDGKAEIIVGVWSGTNRIKAYTGDLNPIPSLDFQPYGEGFKGGNFVAIGKG